MSDKKEKPKAQPLESLALCNNAWPTGDELQKQCPKVWELLMPKMEDGVLVRQPARLSMSVDSGHWRISVTCPTEQVQTSFFLDDLWEFWTAFELLVDAHKLIWVVDYKKAKKDRERLEK